MAGIRLLLAALLIGAGVYSFRKRAEATPSPVPQAPKPKSPPTPSSAPAMTIPPPKPSAPPTSKRHTSLISNVSEKYGRGTLKSGKRFTLAPVWDDSEHTWARADYDDGAQALARLGLRYPTFEELDEIASMPDALILKPCTLVNSAEDGLLMGTKGFWDKHDLCVQAQLDTASWDGKSPLVSVGKHWAHGAPKGRSWLHGWYVPKGSDSPTWQPKAGQGYSKAIQNRGKTFHDSKHVDYSSTLIGVEI